VAVTEESRYQLFQRLEELLGPDKLATLMELLPPVGWADVATKRDLDHLHTLFDAKVDRLGVDLRAEIASGNQALRSEMFREQRNQTLAIIGANTTITALLLAAFQLL
jgi:hypothetical protein